MWKADQWKDYEVLDTSDGEKLERWGKYFLVRPDPQVIWFTARDAMPARPRAAGSGLATACPSAGRFTIVS